MSDTGAKHDQIFMQAVADGCQPIWADGILGWRWHCGCDDNRHGCDSQCSAIMPKEEVHA